MGFRFGSHDRNGIGRIEIWDFRASSPFVCWVVGPFFRAADDKSEIYVFETWKPYGVKGCQDILVLESTEIIGRLGSPSKNPWRAWHPIIHSLKVIYHQGKSGFVKKTLSQFYFSSSAFLKIFYPFPSIRLTTIFNSNNLWKVMSPGFSIPVLNRKGFTARIPDSMSQQPSQNNLKPFKSLINHANPEFNRERGRVILRS